MPNQDYYIGLMSGTSMDAIDGVIVKFNPKPILLASHSQPLPHAIRQQLRELIDSTNAIEKLGTLDHVLGRQFADVANHLLIKTGINSDKIKAIGSHGQTIYHRPDLNFSLQIADPNVIAATTGITTVADFRRKDIALGGQGAPLTPAFHQFCFAANAPCSVVNIGGIANISVISEDRIIGFDCGPGNTLLDALCQRELTIPYDEDGQLARVGNIDTGLLTLMLKDDYFSKPPPKSTGFEYFNLNWLTQFNSNIPIKDLLATLTELTAISIADAIRQHNTDCRQVFLCGGGINNQFLVARLKHHCQPISIASTSEFGIDPQWLEAIAFAWFAQQTMEQLPSNIPEVTGARRKAILGGIYLP